MKRVNDKIIIGFALMFLLIVSPLLFPGSPAYAVGDISCNYNKKRYDTPNQCVPECKVRMKNPMGGCFLSPQCRLIPNKEELKQLYNQAVFLRGQVRRPYSYIALVNYIIDEVIESPDVKSKDVSIQIGNFGCSFYMGIIDEPEGGRHPLRINEKTFFTLSPAYLILNIIHEIQHLGQFKRVDRSGRKIFYPTFFKTKTDYELQLLGKLTQAFKEIEVSYYETQSGLIECLTEKEKGEVMWRKDYWEWNAKESIEQIVKMERPSILEMAEDWFKSNIWTWGNWLPQNPNWKTYKPDLKNKPDPPMECPKK